MKKLLVGLMLTIGVVQSHATELGCTGKMYLNFINRQSPQEVDETINIIATHSTIEIVSNQYGIAKRFYNPQVTNNSYFVVVHTPEELVSINRNTGRIELIRRNIAPQLDNVTFFGTCNVGFIRPKF